MGGLPRTLFDSSGLWSRGSASWASGYFLAARRPLLGVALGTVMAAFGVLVVVVVLGAVVLGEAVFALVTLGVPRVLGVFAAAAAAVAAAAAALPLGVDGWPALGAVGKQGPG